MGYNHLEDYNEPSCYLLFLYMSLKDFEILAKLGDGTYSSVYKVMRKEDSKIYALKRVKMAALSTKQKQNALNQIRILASFNHSNIITYKQAFVDEPSKTLCIVMEFANNGDLQHKIKQKQKQQGHFQQQQIWSIFIQIVKGLNSLHQLNIFHRDIKPANIFLHEEGQVTKAKLGDMNVSKISQKGLCMTQTGTPYYASPQVWKDKPYDSKSDIWSLGCVLYQMITLQPPFKAEDMEGLYKKVIRGIYPKIPSQYSQQLSSMIRFLLQVNPQMRPSCQKILKMQSVLKKSNDFNNLSEDTLKLLETIKPGENFIELNQNLPKPNYFHSKIKKQKGMKSVIQFFEQKNGVGQIEYLPILQKQRKLKISEHTDRVMLKQKQSINMLSRDRKKSEMSVDKAAGNIQVNFLQSKSSSSNAALIKQIKLPKVPNRLNKGKQRIYKQNSLRSHKIYQ